jgi:hypothetical protein
MINILVSGEGKTDMGEINYPYSDLSDLKKGPMIYLIEQIIQKTKNQVPNFGLMAKSELTKKTKKLKTYKFPSKKSGKGTAIFFKNAYILGQIAIEQQYDIAILFRDSDSTQSGIAPDWQQRVNSILQGFIASGFKNGVAMVPKLTSEVWILCCLERHQHCNKLENLAGNQVSDKHPKKILEQKIGEKPTLETLIKIVSEQCDTNKMFMQSFQEFKIHLERLIKAL